MWFTPQQVKGDVFRWSLGIYFAAELIWALFWFISKVYITASMTPGDFVGTRFLSDFNNIGNRLGIPTIMSLLTHWAHEPTWNTLIPLFAYGLYDIAMLYETLFGRHITGILPPTDAGVLQIAVMAFALANTAVALGWFVAYLLFSKKKKATSDVGKAAMDYYRM